MTTWALDLDGVLWKGRAPIAGSGEAVALLLARGHDVVFVTNNSFATVGEQEAKLAAMGIAAPGRFISSAMAAAGLVEPGERAVVLGGPGIVEALGARGAIVVEDPPAEVVVVGLDPALSYARLRAATRAIDGGARFIATNTDGTYPTETGQDPGGGALVAAVMAATGASPTVAGKPHGPQADLVQARFGPDGIMVGDRPDTDGRFAAALGYRFGLVLSGITTAADLPVDPVPDLIGADLAGIVAQAVAAVEA